MFSLLLSALLGCTATTESTEVGVRTQLIGPSRGVEPEYYPPGGTYFFLRALSDFSTFDVGVQNLAMLRENGDALLSDSWYQRRLRPMARSSMSSRLPGCRSRISAFSHRNSSPRSGD